MGLLLLAGLETQGAGAAVAVDKKRAHTEFFGQGEGLLVTGFGLRASGGLRRMTGSWPTPPPAGHGEPSVQPGLCPAFRQEGLAP